jgi:hypothetical protein
VSFAYIAAGQGQNNGDFLDRIGVAENPDAGIGSVRVGGDWLHSSLTAGINDANTNGAQSSDTRDMGDAARHAIIGPVAIKGFVLDNPGASGFSGFIAEKIASIAVHGVNVFKTGDAARSLDSHSFVDVRGDLRNSPASLPRSPSCAPSHAGSNVSSPPQYQLFEKRRWLARVVRANLALLNPKIDGDLLVSLHGDEERNGPPVREIRIADKIVASKLDRTSRRDVPTWNTASPASDRSVGNFSCRQRRSPVVSRPFFSAMSTTTTTTPTTSSTPPQGERGPKMIGADILVAALEREGVDTIFAYPGGASMVMHQALTRSKKIRTILPRHEQGGVFAAEGYARATGKAGVVMATSGPGATNLVTGIADAYLDSTPLVAITGQVPQHMIGKGAFQETDVFSVTAQIVKHNYLVTDINDLARIVKEAFHIAQTGRPGPVLIDIPKNIQMGETQPVFPAEVNLRGYKPEVHCSDAELNELVGLIRQAKKPMIYCGGGIISGEASAELREFAERAQIHVATTLMGIGCFPESHELSSQVARHAWHRLCK